MASLRLSGKGGSLRPCFQFFLGLLCAELCLHFRPVSIDVLVARTGSSRGVPTISLWGTKAGGPCLEIGGVVVGARASVLSNVKTFG